MRSSVSTNQGVTIMVGEGEIRMQTVSLPLQMSILDSKWDGGMSAGRTKSDLMMLTQLVWTSLTTFPLRESPQTIDGASWVLNCRRDQRHLFEA